MNPMRFQITITAILVATSCLAFASKPETVQQLIARAETAKPEDRPTLYVEIADRQLTSADELFTAGKVEDAQARVSDVVAYSEKAHDSAIQWTKKLKGTEIAFRKMAARLRDIKHTVNFDDQAPLQAAADRLENLRTDLLAHMFGKGKSK